MKKDIDQFIYFYNYSPSNPKHWKNF